jgi:hypothetical protein
MSWCASFRRGHGRVQNRDSARGNPTARDTGPCLQPPPLREDSHGLCGRQSLSKSIKRNRRLIPKNRKRNCQKSRTPFALAQLDQRGRSFLTVDTTLPFCSFGNSKGNKTNEQTKASSEEAPPWVEVTLRVELPFWLMVDNTTASVNGVACRIELLNHAPESRWRGPPAMPISSSNVATPVEVLGSSNAGKLDHDQRLDQG